jgi:hypothetical protein
MVPSFYHSSVGDENERSGIRPFSVCQEQEVGHLRFFLVTPFSDIRGAQHHYIPVLTVAGKSLPVIDSWLKDRTYHFWLFGGAVFGEAHLESPCDEVSNCGYAFLIAAL